MSAKPVLVAQKLEDRLEFETLLADLSSRFVNLSVADVDSEIEDALRQVCTQLGIEMAVLWQWSDSDPGRLTPTHLFPAQEGPPPSASLRQDQYPWVLQEISAGRVVVVSSLEEMPAAAAVDRESARLLGIKSNLSIPLSLGGAPPIGVVAFNTLEAERDWPDALVQRLQLVTQVFTNALARMRHELRLQESSERLALAADAAGAGLWVLDLGTGAFWATEGGRAIFGYSPDEIISMERFQATVHPGDWDLVREAIERSADTGEPLHVDYRILAGDGALHWISSRGRPLVTATGEPERIMGVSIDITERKRSEEALRASESRLAAGAELAGLGFYEVDFAAGTMYLDERMREIIGLPPDGEQGLRPLRFWMEHLHPDDAGRILDQREQLHDGRMEAFSFDYRYLHPQRGEQWIQHLADVALRDDNRRTVRSFGVLREITDRKLAEERLRDLSRRLILSQEEERALLARELHDDLSQRVAVLAIDVGRAELAAENGPQAAAMRSVREGLVRLSEDIHTLAYQLHPSVLEELGLAEALRAECERRRRQSRLDLSVELGPLPDAIGHDAALCLFRVAQGALSNVNRHAGARTASLTLRLMDDGLLLAVRDDGVGFDPASPGTGMRLGLASMRERVRLVNGTLDIESAPGRGTSVVAWVPLEREPP